MPGGCWVHSTPAAERRQVTHRHRVADNRAVSHKVVDIPVGIYSHRNRQAYNARRHNQQTRTT